MKIVEWLKERWQGEAPHYKYVKIDASHVKLPDGQAAGQEPVIAGNHYFRLWLAEMYLKNSREWFSTWYPAVHSAIRLQFGNKDEQIAHLAGEARLKDVTSKNLDKVVAVNYAMTGLLPFNGGTVELDAGLTAMKASDGVKTFLKVLGDFSSALMVPQLSAALAIANPLANSIQELIGSTDGRLELGLHDTLTSIDGGGSNTLRAGYFAVILDDKLDDKNLWIDDGKLRFGESLDRNSPLTGYTYMLFRVERRDTRDDWDSLTAIQEPFNQAIEMLKNDNTTEADSYLKSAVIAAFTAKELTTNVDRRRVITQLRERYKEAKELLGQGAVPESEVGLKSVMAGAMTPQAALNEGALLPEEVWEVGM